MRALRLVAALIALLGVGPHDARAEDFPSRPLRLIVTSPPGGLLDVIARLIAQDLGTRLGQNVFIDNRPGAMTQIAVDALVRAPPDGYTLFIGSAEMTMLPFLKKSYRFDPVKDFTPVALVTSSWTVFAINPKLPAATLPEFIAYARERPGALRYGSGGVGGVLHIVVEMLKSRAGIDLVHVPYRGGAQAAADAIAGQIDMVSMGLGSTRIAESGQLRLLAQAGPSRHPLLPDVPTTAEAGLPDVRMDTWFGLLGPPQLPEEVIARLTQELDAVVHQPEFRDKLVKIGCDVAWMPPPVFAAFIAAETKKWSDTIPALGIAMTD